MKLATIFTALATLATWVNATEQNPRIVNGVAANYAADWPFLAWVLSKENEGDEFENSCGGSLIREDLILTAAHCEGVSYRVFYGFKDTNSITTDNQYDVIDVKVHPGYVTSPTVKNDVMLLQLNKPVTGATIIAMNDGSTVLADGEDVKVAGWGQLSTGGDFPDVLMETTLDYLTPTDCQSRMDTGITNNPHQLGAEILCIFRQGTDSCQGDSGGPVITTSNVLIGITSWGFECAGPFPAFNANVATYYNWIMQTADSMTPAPTPAPVTTAPSPSAPAPPTAESSQSADESGAVSITTLAISAAVGIISVASLML